MTPFAAICSRSFLDGIATAAVEGISKEPKARGVSSFTFAAISFLWKEWRKAMIKVWIVGYSAKQKRLIFSLWEAPIKCIIG